MALVNTSKPTTTFANLDRVNSAELWSTITTSWVTETRTWIGCISLFTNTARRLLGSYTFEEIGGFSGDQIGTLTFEDPFTPITNISRPA